MTNDQQQVEYWRKEFEFLFSTQHTGHGFSIGQFGGYESPVVRYMWQGFVMAKRNQPVIELPEYIMCDDQKWIEPSEMMDAITAAGYSYRAKE